MKNHVFLPSRYKIFQKISKSFLVNYSHYCQLVQLKKKNCQKRQWRNHWTTHQEKTLEKSQSSILSVVCTKSILKCIRKTWRCSGRKYRRRYLSLWQVTNWAIFQQLKLLLSPIRNSSIRTLYMLLFLIYCSLYTSIAFKHINDLHRSKWRF